MLLELRIRNFAVIDRLELRLAPGLNVLTGETGAGKSIVVGALSLLVGERASADVVRASADRAVVEGVFDVADRADIRDLLVEQGIEGDDGLLILRREVALEGRNRAWVNGAATTAAFLGELGRRLVDLHGQHEHQTLLRADEQRSILDAYGAATDLTATLREAHYAVKRLRAQLVELERRRAETEQRAELLRFQLEEIEAADPRPAEEEALEEEANRLEHAEELASLAEAAHQELYAAERSVTARLAEIRRAFERLTRYDPEQADAVEALDSAYYALDELGRRMGEYARRIEYDPHRLGEVRRRQDLLFRLRSKYGPTLEDVVETARRARAELDALDGAVLERRTLERDLETAAAELDSLAGELSRRRAAAATRLAAEVMEILPGLGLAGGRFDAALVPLGEIAADGAEAVEFRVALNVGFEPRALARTASGGEISRIMLALKTCLARLDSVPSLVFDEIDVGIGGRVAVQVADRLRDVARYHQVFVITHLPQIASRADHHLRVEKVDAGDGGVAAARVVVLEGEARVRELARMLGGDSGSAAGLEHARELLGAAAAARGSGESG